MDKASVFRTRNKPKLLPSLPEIDPVYMCCPIFQSSFAFAPDFLHFKGFPSSSAGKKSAYHAGDPGLIPRS